jgi:hypothetical protein
MSAPEPVRRPAARPPPRSLRLGGKAFALRQVGVDPRQFAGLDSGAARPPPALGGRRAALGQVARIAGGGHAHQAARTSPASCSAARRVARRLPPARFPPRPRAPPLPRQPERDGHLHLPFLLAAVAGETVVEAGERQRGGPGREAGRQLGARPRSSSRADLGGGPRVARPGLLQRLRPRALGIGRLDGQPGAGSVSSGACPPSCLSCMLPDAWHDARNLSRPWPS